MDLAVHDEILWHACVVASRRIGDPQRDPRLAYPYLVKGSWMNDMNQASPLLDVAGNPNVGPEQATLFEGLWRLSLKDLFDERLRNLPDHQPLLQVAPAILASPQNVDGFGQYNPFDHLDVPIDRPADEYDAAWSSADRFGRASTAHFTVWRHVPNRLRHTSVTDQRFTPFGLTSLGRALHTVADFFAHSNYVELLLWSLAWRKELDPALVDAFNYDDGSNDLGGALFRCPLPAPGPRAGNALRNAVLWYGNSPEETPLVSALFDSRDTVYSLLHIYTSHLMRTDGKPQTEAALELGMAVFDIQGAQLIKGAWEILEAVQGTFRLIGQAARGMLAAGIRAAAVGKAPQVHDLMQLSADLVQRYDSKEANEWARAGRLSFLARELQLHMAKPMGTQSAAGMLLPHHSLIAKDHVGHEAGGQLRFKLACLLATEVSAKLLAWHFAAAAPKLDDYHAIARQSLVHPWRLLQAAGNGSRDIGSRVRQADGSARWQRLALDGLQVLEGNA
ncbi:MAG: hypothetical protein EOO73_05560 [Myxococcales bacterium]|nr:MAG: hypothetical protein EOO73_05560 [Myxococcales bacterium]